MARPWLSDTFISRLQQQDETAYAEVLTHLGPRLVAFAASIVQSNDVAEDMLQTVMMRLWSTASNLNVDADGFEHYLFAAIRNAALSALRSDQRLARVRAAYQRTYADEAVSPTDETGDSIQLHQALDALTEHQRAAIALRYGEGMSIAEVATILGISPKGAEQLLVRVRKILRLRLEQERDM